MTSIVDEPEEEERELVLERRVLTLAHELAELINGEGAGDRDVLREMAVNALRDEVRPSDAMAAAAAEPGSGPFNPFGMAIPTVLMGSLLIFLFPPVGVALFIGAGLMVAWGVIVTLLHRA